MAGGRTPVAHNPAILPPMKNTTSPLSPLEPAASTAAHNAIARRAHALWVARGSPHGSPLEDWLEAERQIAREHHAATGAANEIDEAKLDERLGDFGAPSRPSATSANLP